MMIVKKKEKEAACTVQLHVLRESPKPGDNILIANLAQKAQSFPVKYLPVALYEVDHIHAEQKLLRS